MKKNLFFAVAIMAAMLFTSCIQVCYDPYNPLDRAGQVAFTGTVSNVISTRVNNAGWTNNNQIGVFALYAGQPLASGSIFGTANNVMFQTTGNGNFTTSTPIFFPASGDLDFIAYFPFRASITDFMLPLDVSDQSTPALLNVLWTHNDDGHNHTSVTVPLHFDRKMSQVRIIVNADGTTITSLAGLDIVIEGLATEGEMDLRDGSITVDVTTIDDIEKVAALNPSDNTESTTDFILIPTQNFEDATIRFYLDGRVFESNPFNSLMLASGMRYTFTFELSLDAGARLVLDGATIEDWDDTTPPIDGGTLTPTPSFGVGAGETNLSFPMAGDTEIITLTADANIDWTMTITGNPWLEIEIDGTPAVTGATGTGGADITIKATENTGIGRKATVTFTCDDNSAEPVVIEIAQGGLLFAGSDFSTWAAFESALVSLDARGVASFLSLGGQDGRNGLRIYDSGQTASPFTRILFDANLTSEILVGMSYIEFFINGTSDYRSLSATISAGNTTTTRAWNLQNVTTANRDIVSTGTAVSNGNDTTPFHIDTEYGWTRVRLALSNVPLNVLEAANRFQIRYNVASNGLTVYDLVVDRIVLIP